MDVAIASVIAIAVLWVVFCNSVTYTQRIAMLNAFTQNTDYRNILEQFAAFKAVSYDKHLWYLITFRNPTKLYTQKEQHDIN